MKKWMLKKMPADYRGLGIKFSLDPVVIMVLANRGYDNEEKIERYLKNDLSLCDKSGGLPDLEKAVGALRRFRDEKKKVRIIGDYDIDGVCSTAILLKAFRRYGIDADYVIPHRVLDGYGLNTGLIEKAHEDKVDAIVTCDNGIAAFEAVELANSLGMEVVVTDHHEVPEKIPNALAVVDPKREENTYPFREICGAYVAYKVVARLLWGGNSGNRDALSEEAASDRPEDVLFVPESDSVFKRELMILAGFATVGDVMPLTDENRILVKFCLEHLTEGINPGLEALIEANDLSDRKLSAFSIGFILGPCINATGRLDSAANALELLMCDDRMKAKNLAEMLKEMNEERKVITQQGQEMAIEKVKKEIPSDSVLVLYLPGVHESIAGIIAGRVRETFEKPSIVLTDAEEEGMLKGSGRSIEAYDMFARLSECRELFTKFGGHPMAAGVSLKKENLEPLREFLNSHCGLKEEDLVSVLRIDADMPFSYVTEKVIEDLGVLEPYGNLNEKPVFARRDVVFTGGKIVGKNKDVAIFTVQEPSLGNRTYKLKLFRHLTEFHAYLDETYGPGTSERLYRGGGVRLKVAYYPDLNEFRGERNVEFVMTDYQ